jgi:hypothetical protein
MDGPMMTNPTSLNSKGVSKIKYANWSSLLISKSKFGIFCILSILVMP